MINDQLCHFFQSLWGTCHCVSVTHFPHRQQNMELLPCLPVINPREEWQCRFSRDLGEGKLSDIHKESGCDKKVEGTLEEVVPAKHFTWKGLSAILQILQNIESVKNKASLADLNLERNVTTCQGQKDVFSISHVLRWEEGKALFKLLSGSLQRNKICELAMF